MTEIPGDTPSVTLESSDVYGFAAMLREHSAAVSEQVAAAVGTFGSTESMRDDRPWAADPRNEPAQPIVDYHGEAMELAVTQLGDVATGLSRLSTLTAKIVGRFQTTDELNAAELDEIHDLLNPTGNRER